MAMIQISPPFHGKMIDTTCELPADDEIHVWQAQLDDPNWKSAGALIASRESGGEGRAALAHLAAELVARVRSTGPLSCILPCGFFSRRKCATLPLGFGKWATRRYAG